MQGLHKRVFLAATLMLIASSSSAQVGDSPDTKPFDIISNTDSYF